MPTDNLTDITAELDAVLQPLRDMCAALREQHSPPAGLLTRETFAALLDIGTSTFDRLKESGKIGPRPIKLAGLKWHRDEALAWLRHRAPNGQLHDAKTWAAVWEAVRRRTEQ